MNKLERQSNFELLRILSILFIILYHIAHHGNWGDGGAYFPENITFNVLFLQCLLPLGKLGVDLFVLISGYFLISYSKCTWPKLFLIWAEMIFYSILISGLFVLFDNTTLTPRQTLDIFLPFLANTWWFASAYMIILALSPFLNKMILACDEKGHLRLIVGMLLLWTIIPITTGINLQLNDVIWFFVLYTIAAYIRLYPNRFRRKTTAYLSVAAIVYVILIMITYCIDITGYTSEFWGIYNYIDNNNRMNSPFILIISICLLLVFCKINVGKIKTINVISSTAFGIYLIHDHPLVRQWLYSEFFDCLGHTHSDTLFLYVLLMAGTVFTICSIIELLRIKIIDSQLKRLIDPISTLNKKIDYYLDRFLTNN